MIWSSRKASAPIIPFSSRGSEIDIPEEHPEPPPTPPPPPISVRHSSVNCRSDLPRTSGCRCNCRAQDKVEWYGGRQALNGRHGTERATKRERERETRRDEREGRRRNGEKAAIAFSSCFEGLRGSRIFRGRSAVTWIIHALSTAFFPRIFCYVRTAENWGGEKQPSDEDKWEKARRKGTKRRHGMRNV